MTGPRLGARLWWGAVPLALLLWGAGALLVPGLPGLPQAPFLTQAVLPGATFARDVALAVTVGALAVLLLLPDPRVRRWALGWGVACLALIMLAAWALRADVLAVGIADDGGQLALGTFLTSTLAGRAVIVQLACLLVALVIAAASRSRGARIAALLLALVAVGAPSFAGHAGLAGSHGAAAVAVAVHVAAVCVWVGGLAVVSALLLLDHDTAGVLLPRYSTVALVCVIVVAESGLLATSLNDGTLGDLLGSTYGSIIVAKIVLLAFLIRLGWLQRRRAVDRLLSASVPGTVARIAGIELLAMGGAMAAAVVLGRVGPAPVPATGFAPLTLVALGICAPMVVVMARPRGWRVADGLPEAAAVVLLIVMVEVGGVGLLREFLGTMGLVAELALLAAAGWLAVSATRLPSGRGGLIVLCAGVPVAMALCVVLAAPPVSTRMAVVATILGEGALVAWWRHRREQPTPAVDVVSAVAA